MSENAPHTPEETTTSDLVVLRHFAGLAMQALIAREGLSESESAREEYALWSYRMAQAMLSMEKRLHIAKEQSE